jgi:hypothetical protein
MKDLVQASIANERDISLEEIDISNDPALVERYGLEIPVLTIDGRKAAKYRITREELKKMIDRRRFEVPGF